MVHKVFEISHGERCMQRTHILYTRRTREKQVFMEELSTVRKRKTKTILKKVIRSIGPTWYHALSVSQRNALDTLKTTIYQDLLEGRPTKTCHVIKQLGLYPRPSKVDLMNCMYLGRDDPKQMLAQLFFVTHGHIIDGKRLVYSLNSKLILSAILYLGLDDLIERLKERFQPDTVPPPPPPPPKPKPEPVLASPYLQKMKAVLYFPEKSKRPPPLPLPNLEALDEPFEEEPPVPKLPPPPPLPPPPKQRLPISYCDKIAGVSVLEPHRSITEVTIKTTKQTTHRKVRGSKLNVTEVKKTYGLCLGSAKKVVRRRKPKAPSTGIQNAQYVINGVCIVNGKPVYSLASASILPPQGDLIHGGYSLINGEYINIHCGFRGRPQQSVSVPCDCEGKWHDTIFSYLNETKCHCGHLYDYGNEDSFPTNVVPYFDKPTRNAPYKFNFDAIYNLDEKSMLIESEFKKFWDTDSMLRINDGTQADAKDKKKKKIKRTSGTCLGDKPKLCDYLKCALNLMKRVNVAARLPDIHLVPELQEWMRHRIYGPLTPHQISKLRLKSTTDWQIFLTMSLKGYGHVNPKKDPNYSGYTNWARKQSLNNKFRKFAQQYRLEMFRSHARFSNMFWPTMCQAQLPDKKFREIFFSYLYSRIEDLHLMHPYNTTEVAERKAILLNKRYSCPPVGTEDRQ